MSRAIDFSPLSILVYIKHINNLTFSSFIIEFVVDVYPTHRIHGTGIFTYICHKSQPFHGSYWRDYPFAFCIFPCSAKCDEDQTWLIKNQGNLGLFIETGGSVTNQLPSREMLFWGYVRVCAYPGGFFLKSVFVKLFFRFSRCLTTKCV